METETELALLAHLDTLGTTAIAWPNVDAQATLPRLDVAVFRNDTQRLTIGGIHRRPGILQVTVCTQLGRGGRDANELAEKVAAHFPADLRLSAGTATVRITKAPAIAGGIPDAAAWRVPVSISFETLA